MIDTMIKFSGQKNKPVIGIGFDSNITHEEVRQTQKNGLSLFPWNTSFGADEMLKSIESFLSTGKSWPKHLLEKLQINKQEPKFKDIHLTNRQKQVYDLIARRGLSNKQIAQVLKISESTVKIHVSAVMRALCVRNRTQLALTK
jgi:DNA-binding NarL/FixJ family response regulator